MADQFMGGILAGSQSVSIPVILRVKSDGAELTGKVATAVSPYYYRQGATAVQLITAATLGSMGAAFSAAGWFEIDATNMKGLYRLDLPNTAVSTGAEWVVVACKDTAASGFYFYERFALETVHNNQLNTYLSGLVVALPNGHITSAKIGADAFGSDKFAAGCMVYDDQITTFKSELSGMAISIPNDHITSAKVAAGAFTYDDQITTFKSELSGLVAAIPDGHITAAKIGADAITSAKVAAGAFVYDDQITTFKSELSGMAITIPNDHITSAKVAAGAITYDDQITTFKSELSGMYARLTTLGVRDITQYTSAQGGAPGSSPALYDAVLWGVVQNAYQRIQTPTSYLAHGPGGTALASATVSGTSTQVTIGIFTNV